MLDINIDNELLRAAKNECDNLDLDTSAPFKVFSPGENCVKVLNVVKEQVRS